MLPNAAELPLKGAGKSRSLRALLGALVVLAVSFGGTRAAAQGPPSERQQPDAPQRAAGVDPELAARWHALPPEGRAELRRRFEELRALPTAERDALVRRASEMERLERDVLDELSGEQQARLDSMPAEARRRVVRELALDRARERAERLREVVPAERLAALERGDRAERERARGELRRQHERELPRHLRRVAEELALPPHEVERLAGLPPEVQRVALRELTRRRMEHWVERNGLPEGLDAEAWQRLRAAPPEVFARRYGQLRERFEGQARPFDTEPDGERRPGSGPPWARGGRAGRGGPGGAAHGPTQPPAGVDADAHAWLGRLRAASRPTTEERLELAELAPEQRARELGERMRARVLTVLRELGLDPAELARLEALPPGRWRNAVREAAHAHLGVPLPPERTPPPTDLGPPHRPRRGR
jgi:hypothetical protein